MAKSFPDNKICRWQKHFTFQNGHIFGISTFVIKEEMLVFSDDFFNCNWCTIPKQGGKDPKDYRVTNLS